MIWRTSPIRAAFLKTMSRQARGNERGDAQGAVVDVGDGLHVLDRRRSWSAMLSAAESSPAGAVDLEEDQVDLLLPGLLDPADR